MGRACPAKNRRKSSGALRTLVFKAVQSLNYPIDSEGLQGRMGGSEQMRFPGASAAWFNRRPGIKMREVLRERFLRTGRPVRTIPKGPFKRKYPADLRDGRTNARERLYGLYPVEFVFQTDGLGTCRALAGAARPPGAQDRYRTMRPVASPPASLKTSECRRGPRRRC